MIVGAGISGLQAAFILAEANQSFIILEADDRVGGRICTQSIKAQIKERCYDYDFEWIHQMEDFPIEFGATWIGQHQFLIQYLMSKYKLNTYPHYYENTQIVGHEKGKIDYVKSILDYYRQYP